MVPYIALLIVLIAAVLFAVYKRVDTFEINTTTLKVDSTLEVVIEFVKKMLKQNSDIMKRLESASPIQDTLTAAKMDELGLPYSMKDGKATLTGENITDAMLKTGKQLDSEVQPFLDAVTKLNPSSKLNQILTNEEQVKGFISALEMISKALELREKYVLSKLGSEVGGVKTEELYDAVGGSNQAVKASTVDDTTARSSNVDMTKSKEKDETVKEAAASQSPAATKEMEERIAKSVATQLKDTLLSSRATQNVLDENCPYAAYDSNSTAQGREYREAKPIQTAPDMSEYVRKDSIPCWNCTLP